MITRSNRLPELYYANELLNYFTGNLWGQEGKVALQFLTDLGLSETMIVDLGIGFNPSTMLMPPFLGGYKNKEVLTIPRGFVVPNALADYSFLVFGEPGDWDGNFIAMDYGLPISHSNVFDFIPFYEPFWHWRTAYPEIIILTSNLVDTILLKQELGEGFNVLNYHSAHLDNDFHKAVLEKHPGGIILTTITEYPLRKFTEMGNIISLQMPTTERKLRYVYELPKAGLDIKTWFDEQNKQLGLDYLLGIELSRQKENQNRGDDMSDSETDDIPF